MHICKQIVQEILKSNTPADSSATSETGFPTTDLECLRTVETLKETMVTVCHAQTQVIMKPETAHQGRQIDYTYS